MDQWTTPEGYKLCPELQKQVDGVSSKKTMRNLKEPQTFQDKWDKLEKDQKEDIIKIEAKHNAGFETRKIHFNMDIVDDECEREREREEFEVNL